MKPFKSLFLTFKRAMGFMSPPAVLAYRGYGNHHVVVFHGHVLDDRILLNSKKEDRSRKNFKAMLSRYVSNVIPDVRVKISFMGLEQVAKTNENGYFKTLLDLSPVKVEGGWLEASFEVLDKVVEDQKEIKSTAEVYIQKKNCDFGIISDVDDTILVSHATEILKKLRLVLTKNAYTRLPFKGISAFYQALVVGKKSTAQNPIFFVSSSEWNLYDFLVDFCKVRNIPKGVFLLQNYKKNLKQLLFTGGGNHEHKLIKIREILVFYPKLNFILIGDNGQKDPEIYCKIVDEFPGRILSIYIRDVSKNKKNEGIKEIIKKLQSNGVEMLMTETTIEAAKDAVKKGYIDSSYISVVEQETKSHST